DERDLLLVAEDDRPRVADPPAVDVHTKLLAASGAVSAEAARGQADAPLVEELAERVGARPVGLDVDDPARGVSVERRDRNLRDVDVARGAVAGRSSRLGARAAVAGLREPDPGRNRELAAVHDQVEVVVVVPDEEADHRDEARIAEAAGGVAREAPGGAGRARARRPR